MILEKNNLQTVQEWTKSHIELIASYVHPKNSKYHLQSHLRAIMAQDHSRLRMENKFLKNKSGQIFGVWQVLNCTKSCQQMWGHVNQPFVLFMHHIWGETVLFIIQTSDNAVFHNFSRQFALSQYSLRKINRELLAITLQHNKEFIMFFFYLRVL